MFTLLLLFLPYLGTWRNVSNTRLPDWWLANSSQLEDLLSHNLHLANCYTPSSPFVNCFNSNSHTHKFTHTHTHNTHNTHTHTHSREYSHTFKDNMRIIDTPLIHAIACCSFPHSRLLFFVILGKNC